LNCLFSSRHVETDRRQEGEEKEKEQSYQHSVALTTSYPIGASMKNPFFRKRIFLNPISTGNTSYVLAEAESSRNGEYKWGNYLLTIADCRRRIQLEFVLGTKRTRRISLAKINLLIEVLTRFRDALLKENELIEQFEQAGKKEKETTLMTKTRQLMMPNALQRSTVSKDVVIDWLGDVHKDAKIGIDVGQFGQLDLVAFLEGGETDMWILALDAFVFPADKSLLDESREEMMKRLRQIHADGGETEKGVMIVTIEGVVSGDPDLFSMNVDDAFTFKDTEQANAFVDEFFDVLRNALILDC
jgi:hypothetical protein